MMMQENEQRKLQSLLLQIRSYQDALQEIERQIAVTERALMEIIATISALTELPKTKQSESFIPVGGGIYVKSEIKDKKNVIVSIGGGVCLEKTTTEAKAYLEKRKKELEATDEKLREQAQKISAELESANKAAEDLYIKLQGEK